MEGWEEPLHSGSLRRSYPTLSHLATHFACFVPPGDTTLVKPVENAPLSRHFRGGRNDPCTPPSRGRALAVRPNGRDLAAMAGFRRSVCMGCWGPWGTSGSSLGWTRRVPARARRPRAARGGRGHSRSCWGVRAARGVPLPQRHVVPAGLGVGQADRTVVSRCGAICGPWCDMIDQDERRPRRSASAVAGRAQLAAVGEGRSFEDAHGAYERLAAGLLQSARRGGGRPHRADARARPARHADHPGRGLPTHVPPPQRTA